MDALAGENLLRLIRFPCRVRLESGGFQNKGSRFQELLIDALCQDLPRCHDCSHFQTPEPNCIADSAELAELQTPAPATAKMMAHLTSRFESRVGQAVDFSF